jgi:hypothetical protein
MVFVRDLDHIKIGSPLILSRHLTQEWRWIGMDRDGQGWPGMDWASLDLPLYGGLFGTALRSGRRGLRFSGAFGRGVG